MSSVSLHLFGLVSFMAASSASAQTLEYVLDNPIKATVATEKLKVYSNPYCATSAGSFLKGDSVFIVGWRTWAVQLQSVDKLLTGYAVLDGINWPGDSLRQVIEMKSPAMAKFEIAEANKRLKLLNRAPRSYARNNFKHTYNGISFEQMSGAPWGMRTTK